MTGEKYYGKNRSDEVVGVCSNVYKNKFSKMWIDYDEDADVLYLNFKKPCNPDDTEMTEDDIIIRYEANEIVGLTILNASKLKN